MGRIHMNFKKKLLLLATSALAMLTLSACSKNSSSTDGKVATNITKKTTVVFWHSMTGASEKLSLIHISEPTRPLYISYAVFCLKKKK